MGGIAKGTRVAIRRPRETRPGAAVASAAFGPAVGALIALAVGIGIGRFVYTPILPAMIAGLGLSKLSAGLIASANFAGYLVGALLAAGGRLPGTRRVWLLAGLSASAASTAAMGLVSHSLAFMALRFVGGAASALVLVFTSALLLDFAADRERPAVSAVMFAGVGVGIAVSAVLVSLLSAAGQGWADLWLASGLLSALAAVAVVWMIPARAEAQTGRPDGSPPVAKRRLISLVLAYGLFGFGYVITATFLVAIVRDNPAIRQFEMLVWVVFGLAAAPSVAFWNWLGARHGIARAFALAALTEAGGVLASVGWPTTAGVFVASICVGGTFMGLTALGLMRGRELARGDARQMLGLMTSAFGLGQIVGPSFAGFVVDRLHSFAIPSVVAAAALAVAAALALLDRA
jgi:predicted MFS family arabinose efflux permease